MLPLGFQMAHQPRVVCLPLTQSHLPFLGSTLGGRRSEGAQVVGMARNAGELPLPQCCALNRLGLRDTRLPMPRLQARPQVPGGPIRNEGCSASLCLLLGCRGLPFEAITNVLLRTSPHVPSGTHFSPMRAQGGLRWPVVTWNRRCLRLQGG